MTRPRPDRRRLLRCLPAAGVLPWQAAWAQPATPDASEPRADSLLGLPQIELLDGSTWAAESWQGLAGVVVIWATWCPFCHRHNRHLEALYRSVEGRPIRILGASLDLDPERVRKHVRELGFTFPVSMNGEVLRRRFALRKVTPTTVTFDRRGRLLQRIPGEMFEEDVLALARLADVPA